MSRGLIRTPTNSHGDGDYIPTKCMFLNGNQVCDDYMDANMANMHNRRPLKKFNRVL